MAAAPAADTVGMANSDVDDAALGAAQAGWLAPKRDDPDAPKVDELEAAAGAGAAAGAAALVASPNKDVAGALDAAGAEL